MSDVRLDLLPPIKLGATPVEVREHDGWKIYEGTAAFGDVLHEYPEDNPPTVEFRPADEALAEETLRSSKTVPVTWDHPLTSETPDGLLVSATTQKLIKGAVQEAWREGDKFRVRLMVYTPDLQAEIEKGAVELSLGYRRFPDRTPGEFQGKRYDLVQRSIRINHLAIVPLGKSARSARPDGTRARLDAEEAKKTPVYPHFAGPKPTMKKKTARTDALVLTPEGQALLAQMSAEDQEAISALAGSEDMSEEADEMAEDEAQDESLVEDKLAPLMDKIAKIEETLAGLSGAVKDSMKPVKKTRTDSAPSIDIEAIVKQAREAALEAVQADAKFMAQVRVDGFSASTATEAAAHMVETIKTHLPTLLEDAVDAVKTSRLDSLTRLYKTAEQVRRDSAAQRFTDAVLPSEEDAPLLPTPRFVRPVRA